MYSENKTVNRLVGLNVGTIYLGVPESEREDSGSMQMLLRRFSINKRGLLTNINQTIALLEPLQIEPHLPRFPLISTGAGASFYERVAFLPQQII